MAGNGPNLTGVPETDDYTLGRGILYFAEHDTAGRPKGFRDLGNAPELNVATEVETLEHMSSRGGLKTVDKEVTLSQKMTLSFQLDEVNHENLALLFSGDKADHTNSAIAGFAANQICADGDLELGRWYDIVAGSSNSYARAYDVAAADVTVTTTESSPITLVKDTDYTLDETMGRILILSTSTKAATAIAAVKGFKVALAANAAANEIEEVKALTNTTVTGCLKFIGVNPINDRQREYTWHSISLKANGDFALIGDDWTKMPFSAKAEYSTTYTGTLTIRDV